MKIKLNSEQMRWLRDCWKGDITNKIVITLNEGLSLNPILKKLKKKFDIPDNEDRMDLRYIDLSHQNLRGPWKQDGERQVRGGVNLKDVDLTSAWLLDTKFHFANVTEA